MEPKGLFFAPTEMIERCAIIMLPVRLLLVRLLVFGSAGGPVSDGLCGWRLTCGMTADHTLLPSQPATAVASAAQPAAIPASRRSQGWRSRGCAAHFPRFFKALRSTDSSFVSCCQPLASFEHCHLPQRAAAPPL